MLHFYSIHVVLLQGPSYDNHLRPSNSILYISNTLYIEEVRMGSCNLEANLNRQLEWSWNKALRGF